MMYILTVYGEIILGSDDYVEKIPYNKLYTSTFTIGN